MYINLIVLKVFLQKKLQIAYALAYLTYLSEERA